MSAETVKVMVRCRPMNKLEISKNCGTCVQVDIAKNQIVLVGDTTGEASKVFTYDYVFPQDILQQTVYENSAFPLVESVVEGYNGTIFAYGQTGCGKTHSMLGKPNDEIEKGIIPRSFSHIINIVESTNDKNFLIRCSYIEIYNEEIHDLLGKDTKARMDLKESPDKGVFVKDLTTNPVKTVAEMEKWMNIGTDNRSVGATAMNKDSSRSHSLFTLHIECSYKVEGEAEEHYTAGKLNLVDLAGSERQSKTQATGDRLKEATKINLSLSALGNVISALVDGKSQHIPYRDSKLTRLLQDSLGGNTKTIMIAAVSPADYNYEETLSTLRYASRAKNIKNQPKVNQDPKDALLKEYADEIKKLKEMLLKQQGGEQISFSIADIPQQQQLKKQPSIQAQNPSQNNMLQSQLSVGGKENKEELKKLKEKNNALNEERIQMENELKQREMLFQEQQREKENIAQKLKEMEKNMVVGGTADQEKKKKVAQMRNKLKKQMQEHEKITEEIQKKEEDFLFLENKYSSLQEELDETKKIARKLRAKLKQAQGDAIDLQREKEREKEDLLESIRYEERELKIYQAICQMLLTSDEIEIIKSQGSWVDDYSAYKIPPFFLKQKKMNFPRLPEIQAQQLVEQEKELREVEFQKNNNKAESANNNFNATFYGNGMYKNGGQKNGSQNNNNNNNQQQLNEIQQNNRYTKEQDDTKYVAHSNGRHYQQQSKQFNEHSFNNNDPFDKQDNQSISSNVDQRKEPILQSPQFIIKKSHQKLQVAEKQKVPNVSLDPLDTRSANQKLQFYQENQLEQGNGNGNSEHRKIQTKSVQLQPLQPLQGSKPNLSQQNLLPSKPQFVNPLEIDPLTKTPNRVKLEKLYVPR